MVFEEVAVEVHGDRLRGQLEGSAGDCVLVGPDGTGTVDVRVTLTDGRELAYDYLVIATGTTPRPDQTPGMLGAQWRTSISSSASLSGFFSPSMCLVKPRLTNRHLRLVTGWVRTTGWTASGNCLSLRAYSPRE